jgi:hypothetical protein
MKVLILVSLDKRTDFNSGGQPFRFRNPSQWGSHRKQSLLEMQTGIKPPPKQRFRGMNF